MATHEKRVLAMLLCLAMTANGAEGETLAQMEAVSGIGTSADGNLFISQVLHQTYISVDAKGTKAAAVTMVGTDTGAAPADPRPSAWTGPSSTCSSTVRRMCPSSSAR